ncbi:hypothetical protein [Prochlorococcus marinus]|uniref:Uncharacterized protein n=1 Tax=Prochlorococcus marinus (strain MIT 9211) TaxID=93059 RepID=A9BA70_PROM4|nr:hypothetical protein [Prochlorococcus marinus]ABX08732.1 Hypothetical protein P9211_08011 [Prochlorococcus marinus str. MIT 9211]
MNLTIDLAKLTGIVPTLSTEAINNSIIGLAPSIKTFIAVVAILGPLSIAGIILFLKKIEQKRPDRIRWR